MSEVRARAHEAALAASLACDSPDSYDECDKHEAVADAVLAVVADYCDEMDKQTRDEHGNYFGPFGWDHSSNEGASAAFEKIERACRVQEDK